jgi:hypothetical protein
MPVVGVVNHSLRTYSEDAFKLHFGESPFSVIFATDYSL